MVKREGSAVEVPTPAVLNAMCIHVERVDTIRVSAHIHRGTEAAGQAVLSVASIHDILPIAETCDAGHGSTALSGWTIDIDVHHVNAGAIGGGWIAHPARDRQVTGHGFLVRMFEVADGVVDGKLLRVEMPTPAVLDAVRVHVQRMKPIGPTGHVQSCVETAGQAMLPKPGIHNVLSVFKVRETGHESTALSRQPVDVDVDHVDPRP